jgi:beta-glucosidase
LIAHGTAVKIYREEFKPAQKGQIGITLNGKTCFFALKSSRQH